MGAGVGHEPPHWLVKYAKSHVFCAFEADFLWKMENRSPPYENSPPSNVWICEIGRKISLNFGEDLFFFFLEITWFWVEKTFEFRISAEKSLWILAKTFFFFFFGDHLIFGGKNLWISDFGRKITLNFGEDLFFFWRSPNLGRKKPLNIRAFRDISSQFSDKPPETDSRSMKIRVKVVCTLLTLSK